MSMHRIRKHKWLSFSLVCVLSMCMCVRECIGNLKLIPSKILNRGWKYPLKNQGEGEGTLLKVANWELCYSTPSPGENLAPCQQTLCLPPPHPLPPVGKWMALFIPVIDKSQDVSIWFNFKGTRMMQSSHGWRSPLHCHFTVFDGHNFWVLQK